MSKVFATIVAGAVCLSASAAGKELKVLTIGNSFSQSLKSYFVNVAESADLKLLYDGIVIGGCSLEKHWNNINFELKNPGAKYFGTWGYLDKLKAERWDVVTIQQSSHDSWNYDTFMPFAKNICEVIRKYAPQAEIMIQQTWAYTPNDPRLAQWGITSKQMAERSADNYRKLGRELNCKVIPMGDAVEMYRRKMKVVSPKVEKSDVKVPDTGNDVVGFVDVRVDNFHLNANGRYLQACVWTGFLFGIDPTSITLQPDELSKNDVVILREIARDTLLENQKKAAKK